MRATIHVNVSCTIDDPFVLLDLARREVEKSAPPEHRQILYPDSATGALQVLVRTALVQYLVAAEGVTLHEIGIGLLDSDMPL